MPDILSYNAIPTIKQFHQSTAPIRAIVGPIGSGKTSAVAMEGGYYIPHYAKRKHGLLSTRGVVVRNTYRELMDTTVRTIREWFPGGAYQASTNTLILRYDGGIEVEILFRSCDREDDLKKFKSLEITWYWCDEAIEIPDAIKRMLKGRIGRYPKLSPIRYGMETSNPPDVEHEMYSQFAWQSPPPGPIPKGEPLEGHKGFWQSPRENEANLRLGYYDDLIRDYRDNPDWISVYVEGKPGIIMRGRLVYANFRREYHVSKEPLFWSRGTLYRGWDDSGNSPACVVLQVPSAGQVQVLAEFYSDRMGIVDFGNHVKAESNLRWSNAEFVDWDDPAGHNTFPKREGGFTSNAELMKDECGIKVQASEQNWEARKSAVDQLMLRYDGLLIDPSCTRLINGFLGGYCYPRLGMAEVYGTKPVKDKFSHVHDALQYVLVKLVSSTRPQPKRVYDRAESERVHIIGGDRQVYTKPSRYF